MSVLDLWEPVAGDICVTSFSYMMWDENGTYVRLLAKTPIVIIGFAYYYPTGSRVMKVLSPKGVGFVYARAIELLP